MNKSTSLSYLLFFLLFALALLWNLGLTAIGTDEPTRTIVAQEILIQNNWFYTTINGVPYYNKPPLYNWIIIGFYKITGSKSEFVTRLPVVISILLIIGTLYFWLKKYFTKEIALLAGLIFLTGSRVWLYDSMLGLIDMFFGLLIILMFVLVYELEKLKKYTLLFVLTYLIIAICFLMKGLQALVFQAVTLLAWFIYKKDFKRLFYWSHFLGIGVFALAMGLYLWVYNMYHPVENLLETLWTESTRRTVGGRPWYEDAVHLLTFPFKNVLADFLPWSLLLGLLFVKKIRGKVFSNEVLVFCLICAGSNFLVYWISPETRGRYLFPHFALLSIVIAFISVEIAPKIERFVYFSRVLLGLVLVAIVILYLGVYVFALHPKELNFFLTGKQQIQLIILFFTLLITMYLLFKYKTFHWSLIILLLSFRLIFDAVVIPYRAYNEPFTMYKDEAIRIGKTYKDKPLVVFKNTPIDHRTTHYLLLEQNRIIPRVEDITKEKDSYYIVDRLYLYQEKFILIDSFPQQWEERTMYVGKAY